MDIFCTEEKILLALYEVENRLQTEYKNVSSYESRENTLLKDDLLKSFDPFINEEIRTGLQEKREMDLEDKEALTRYYKEPVMCMLRIKDSVVHWLKRNGSDGYFDFLEGWLGDTVPNDDKMNYSIDAGTRKI